MYIKAIVLDNFKSFGRKTRIPLYEDFTVITGPNGCGKSNIIDAVLFGLGLARSSGIRAKKQTELIYDPGYEEGDRPGGDREASVEVVLDNSDGTLERSQVVNAADSDDVGEVEEIRIRRRVRETEEGNSYSYYYLNDRAVNLGDITDLLAQAGVTPEGYNVVMQGDVTGIINMTPWERRGIIDEIAGVAEFDEKKADAFEELEVVQERIDEAALRIEEKRDRLDQLADERTEALRYRRLEREKKEYEGYLKASELEEKREELVDLEESVETLTATLEQRQQVLDEKQGALTRLEEDLEDLNAEIQRKGESDLIEIQRSIEQVKGEISRIEDSIDATQERIDEAEAERGEAFVALDRKQEELDEIAEDIKEKKLDKASLKSEIQELEAERDELEAELESVGSEYESVKEELESLREDLESAKQRKSDLQREQDRLTDEARRRTRSIEEANAAIEDSREAVPELEEERADLEREREKAERNRENIESVVEDLREEKRELKSRLEEIDDELRAKQAEYAELEAGASQGGDSSFGKAVTTILNAGMDGIHGAIAQLGDVSSEYATACETAAGGRLANVVVDDDGVGQRCIEYLKSRNAGRATFLPQSEMRKRRLPNAPSDPGVIGFAYDLVEFDDDYAGVFSYVLGDTLVVEDIETARAYMGEFRMVTLEGDLVEKSGAMTGGSRKGSRYSFTRGGKGQLERVAEAIVDLEDQRSSVQADLRGVEERLDDARDRKSDAADEVRSIEASIEGIDEKLERIEEEVAGHEETIAELEAEREEVDEEMTELTAAIEECAGEIAEIEETIEEHKAEIRGSKIPELTEGIESLEDDIRGRQDRIREIDSDLNALRLEQESIEGDIEELNEDIEDAQNRMSTWQETIEDHEAAIEEHEESLAEKEATIEEIKEELSDLHEERESLQDAIAEAREERDAAKEQAGETERELESTSDRLEALEWEIESLEEEVGEYDPDAVPDLETVREMIAVFEADMTAMEPVNMKAIDDYDAVAETLAELEDGKATLQEEADGIRERIERYETEKKETFMEAFEAIAGHFTDIFEELSDGTGTLSLEDEEDPFEGGLLLEAEPSGKQVKRLDLMSGGEKSLTALAFIFAIQRHNPAPFYALDEIDAFLDAANVDLVGEMVDSLSDQAQFVVVSHRSAMLDRSDRVIGVTMQDDNISAVTGIDVSARGVPADD